MRNPFGRSPAGCTLVGILAMLAAPATSIPTTRERGARLVVHIGPHKTGSSALQQSLLSLEKAGFLRSIGWTWPNGFTRVKSPYNGNPKQHCLIAGALRQTNDLRQSRPRIRGRRWTACGRTSQLRSDGTSTW